MNTQPLSTQIAERLEDIVIRGDKYFPGQQMPNERELSELLGASRTTIREAIKQLVARDILTIRRGVGTFVSKNPGITRDPLGIDSETDKAAVLIDWYRVRMALEGEAMEMICANATDEELQQIRNLMLDLEHQISEASSPDMLSDDQNFHCALARATHNVIMERLIPSLHATVYYDLVKSFYGELRPRYNLNAIESHRMIVKHLEQRDGNGAKIAMHYHMLRGIEDIQEVTGPKPDKVED